MRNWDGTQSIVTNSILWGNMDIGGSDESAQIHGDTPVITFSCIQDDDPDDTYIPFGGSDSNNIDDDPMFVRNPDPGSDGQWDGVDDDFGDLHLLAGSPCINAGDPDFVYETSDVDMDGQPRVVGGCVDIGADEFVYIGDLDFSGSVDMVDLAMFALAWLSEPTDEQWNPNYDISIPADNYIDMLDLNALVANWLAGL